MEVGSTHPSLLSVANEGVIRYRSVWLTPSKNLFFFFNAFCIKTQKSDDCVSAPRSKVWDRPIGVARRAARVDFVFLPTERSLELPIFSTAEE